MRRRVQGAGEILERVKPLCDEAGAGHGTDRRAGDDVGLETRFDQSLEHADVGPAARRAAAERDPKFRSFHAAHNGSLMPGKIRQLGRKRPGAR